MQADRLPPHDIESEEAVIGSLLVDSEAFTRVIAFLDPNDFYRERNRWCYEACFELFQRREAIDQISVAHELERTERLADVGGTAYLGHLVEILPTSRHVEHYGRIVQRTSTMRKLIRAAMDISEIGYEEEADVDAALSRAEDALFQIRSSAATRDFVPLTETLNPFLEQTTPFTDLDGMDGRPIGTGFKDLDDLLGGMSRSDMIVLAARPSVGKTMLGLNIARNSAAKVGVGSGATVGIFSLEMGREQIALRLLSAEARVDMHNLRMRLLSEIEQEQVFDSVGVLSDLSIYIDDTPIQSVAEMRSKARRLQMEHGLDFVVIDYMQLIRGNSRRSENNRAQEVSEISRSIKGMARDLQVPILALSQLSRAIEHRTSHRPMLSDLRESGSIEQDADVVIFIHREDKFAKEEDWVRDTANLGKVYPRGLAEMIVAKHRNGPTGSVELAVSDAYGRFQDNFRRVAESRV
ncbi:MAG TPA: replicative DNA helicase [Dehalococcoidia bacterium]|nr:replicative DNA helicase [Dehalococcoidia bacterium]MDP7161055.1 replicative DNA helicase [Dehalococcoidia bacterium]MDP7213011.1 replicative DNA helicase [Dehalococcoidia bacterium]MDP7514810.1 replicative DNA helicase [Dehalococcoidia bacterium]HJM53570.1 replicative DNA helicase [Dehalococcoidia bacterium]